VQRAALWPGIGFRALVSRGQVRRASEGWEGSRKVIEKLGYYDILGVVVPGTLLLALIRVCFPGLSQLLCPVGFPEAFLVVILIALALFLGHLVQAIASSAEPLLYWTWGGRPSDRALQGGLDGYLPQDSAARIKKVLARALGGEPSDHSLFLFAVQKAHAAEIGRASQFNSLYGYHRGILTLLVLAAGLLVAAMVWGQGVCWTMGQKVLALVAIVLVLLLVWHRAKQSAFYYVREILLTAERVVGQQPVEGE